MEKDQVIVKVNQILTEEFEIEENKIDPDANIFESLEIDSLDLVDLVVLIEQNFGFKVKNEEMTDIRTLNDFYNYVAEKA